MLTFSHQQNCEIADSPTWCAWEDFENFSMYFLKRPEFVLCTLSHIRGFPGAASLGLSAFKYDLSYGGAQAPAAWWASMAASDAALVAVLLLDLFYPSIAFSTAPSCPEKDTVNSSIFF